MDTSSLVDASAFHEKPPENRHTGLQDHVQKVVKHYFANITDKPSCDLYQTALGELELPLISEVMKHVKANQSKAAILLGVSRGTLRKKLKIYGLN
jgi:Fis family transcriptional regulator